MKPRRADSILRNGLYNVVGQTLRGVAAVLAIPFLIRFLGIREYGVWSLSYAVLALLATSEASISVAAAVFLPRDLADDRPEEVNKTLAVVFAAAVLLASAVALFLWFVGPLLVRPLADFGVSDRAEAALALQVAGLAAAALILERTLVGVEQAFGRYGAINCFDLTQGAIGNAGLVVAAWLGGKAVAMMEWQTFAYVVLLFAHCVFVLRLFDKRKLGFAWSKSKAKRILRFSGTTWLSAMGSAAFGQCDRYLVAWILGAPALGVYAAITNVTSRINAFSGTAVQPLVPSLSLKTGLATQQEAPVRQAVYLNALIAIEAGVFLYVLSDWVVRVLALGTSTQCVLGLQIAAIIYALYSINAPGYFILFSIGAERTNAAVVLSSAFVALILIFIGARYFGVLGALAGNVGYVGTLWMTALGLRKLGVAFRSYLSWIALPASVLAAGLVIGVILEDHFWWRVAFVLGQACVVTWWFLRRQERLGGLRMLGRVAQC